MTLKHPKNKKIALHGYRKGGYGATAGKQVTARSNRYSQMDGSLRVWTISQKGFYVGDGG